MLSRNNFNSFFDSDFDFFAPIHRRFHRGSTDSSGAVAKREEPRFNNPFAETLTKFYDDGFDSFWFPDRWSSDAFRGALDNHVDMKEEPDKYVIEFKIADPKTSDIKIDYLKKENQLVLSYANKVTEENKDDKNKSSSFFSRSFKSSIRFDKAIDSEHINADIKDDQVLISVPKVEKDEENVINVYSSGKKEIE